MDKEAQKKAIYERMSSRRKRFVDRIGYDKWDPFQEPKHPIEIRTEATQRTAQDLYNQFFAENEVNHRTSAYNRGVYEFCMGIFGRDDRFRGIFDFCQWYAQELRKRNIDPAQVWDD
ncbi:MAG: hypothetical protein R6U55_10000 [Desulfovermiculus sp.]